MLGGMVLRRFRSWGTRLLVLPLGLAGACDAGNVEDGASLTGAAVADDWLTEFSCGDGNDRSLEKQKQYMQEALPILEGDAMVERYAWFSGRTTAIPNVNLLAADGQLTELGQLYVDLPHADPRCAR